MQRECLEKVDKSSVYFPHNVSRRPDMRWKNRKLFEYILMRVECYLTIETMAVFSGAWSPVAFTDTI